jgi:hypothetical protein
MRTGTTEILIAGIALFISGIIIGGSTLQMLLEGSYSLLKFDNLTSGDSVTKNFDMSLVYRYNNPGVNMSLVVDSESSNIPMKAEVRQPDGIKLVDVDFRGILTTTFTPIVGGEHIITIRNLGTENASIKLETGTTYFLANSYFNPESMISRNFGLTGFLIFLGLIILVYGGIIFQIRGRIAKIETTKVITISTGLRTYAVLAGVAAILTIIIVSEFVPILMSELTIAGGTQDSDIVSLLFAAPVVIILVGIGIAYLVIMAGFLYFRKGWIWSTAVVMSFISIILSLITSLILEMHHNYSIGIANMIINGTALYYLYRAHVRIYFGKAVSSATTTDTWT